MRDTRRIGIGREALYSLISKLTMAALGFGGTVVFARLLGASDLGVYRTALAAAFVLTQVSDGTGLAIRKRVSEVDVAPGRYLGTGLLIHAAMVVVVLLGTLLLLTPASAYFGSMPIALGVVAIVASLGFFNVVNRTYAGIGYPARATWMDTVRSVLTLGAQLGFLAAGYEVIGLIGGLAIGSTLTAVITGVVARVPPQLPNRHVLDRVISFARWSIPNNLLTNLYSSADVIILTAIVGTTASGLYAVSSQLVMPAAFLASSISGALSVKGSGRHSAGESVAQDLLNSIAYTGLFALPMLFGALAMPRAIPLTVFGPEFRAAGAAFVGLALFQIGNVYAKPFESIFEGMDRPELVFRVNAVIAVVHIPVAILLAFRFGLVGVVAATVVAELLRNVTYQVLAYWEFDRVALPRPVFEQLASAIVMFAVLELALRVVEIDSWLVLGAVVGGGAVVYFVVLSVLSRHFRSAVRYALPMEWGPFRRPDE